MTLAWSCFTVQEQVGQHFPWPDDHSKSQDQLFGNGQTDNARCASLESGNSGLASTSSHCPYRKPYTARTPLKSTTFKCRKLRPRESGHCNVTCHPYQFARDRSGEPNVRFGLAGMIPRFHSSEDRTQSGPWIREFLNIRALSTHKTVGHFVSQIVAHLVRGLHRGT